MKRRPRVLDPAFVRKVTEPGRYGDGRGSYGLSLIVSVRTNGRTAKAWAQRIRIDGKVTNVGLGTYPLVKLQKARELALANARMIQDGRDPRTKARQSKVPSFRDAAEAAIELRSGSWKNPEHSAVRWRTWLRDYVYPRLGSMPVNAITAADVLAVLKPIWNEQRATAVKVRQTITTTMQWAIAHGHRTDDPTGRTLTAALPKKKNGTAKHHKALPHAEVADCIRRVQASRAAATTKALLEFTVLTATRSGEARLATWDEADLETATWTIPSERMKGGREHRVPLADRALAVLTEAERYRDRSGLLFPGASGKALSHNTVSRALKVHGSEDATVHGFRTSFRSWCADENEPRELAEAALAHVAGAVEAAYQRSDMLERRRELMEKWADYINPQ